ncbi:ATP-binding protein [Streptomyces sp. NPDC003857]
MSTNEVDASVRPAPSPPRGGIRGFAERWPFRRKLNVLVGVPLAVVAVLLAYLITDLVQQSDRAESAARLVRDSTQVARLVGRVQAEHQQAILLSVRYEASVDTRPSLSAYRSAQDAVDDQIAKVRSAFGDRLPDTEEQALMEVEGLAGLRDTIEQGYLPADNIDPAYTNASKGLIDGLGLERNADLAATFTGNLLDSLLRADAAHGAFETGVFSATTGDANALIEFTGAVGSHELFTYQADRFGRFASPEQADELAGIEHNTAQWEIAQAYAALQVDPSGLQMNTPADIGRTFTDALNGYPAYPEQAENRLRTTTSLIDQIADRADAASETAQWRAALLLNLALISFVCWIALSVLVRRSVVRPVLALTGAAQQVAKAAGRELSRVADDDAEDDGAPRLREISVTARDEIGELAEAFNHVQTTAAALLERQVLSRRNVAEMFGNVGRRVSNLTTRQLVLIDAVERGETDPALLERLYSIDHIAVRLRRNADSLMLLAGIRETVLESGPTALTNVVRAALGQIEGFQRVRLLAETEIMVAPDIIGDLTLMVAELLENAVSFSPAGSPVEVTVRMGGEGAVIEVADHGLGMSAERLAEENARLIRRERLDVVPTKVLGLFVVGTLARRWEITVVLARTPGGGVTATVELPSSLLLTMSPVLVPEQVPAAVDAPGTTGQESAATSGPVPSAVAVAETASEAVPAAAGQSPSPGRDASEAGSGSLPRRVPRREADPVEERASGDLHDRAEEVPFVPRPRSRETAAGARAGGTPPGADVPGGVRPLRRRVRGATLRTAEAPQTESPAPRPADAEEVRSALEEFEAAVERAHRDSTARTSPHDTLDQNHLPKGAEQ